MKTYSKILGIVSALIILGILGVLIYAMTYESSSSGDKLIALSFLLPVYVLLHFLIIHRFGFNLNAEYTPAQKKTILIISIVTFTFLLSIPLKTYLKSRELANREKSFEEMKDLGSDSTAFNYYGQLKIKYVDRKIYYQLSVNSKTPFKSNLTGFTVHLLDKDGFLIEEIAITDYSNLVEEDKTYGIHSNANRYMDLDNYSRIEKWDLLVTTEN